MFLLLPLLVPICFCVVSIAMDVIKGTIDLRVFLVLRIVKESIEL